MSVYADNLARLRVATVCGRLPEDLGAWALATLTARMKREERAEARNQLLRRAANLVSGSTWARALRIRREILTSKRVSSAADTDGVRALVAEALAHAPAPQSLRQVLRILGSDTACR